MERSSLYFIGKQQVAVKRDSIDHLPSHQVLVKTLHSAISAGTELLVYRDQWPQQMAMDESISALNGRFQYPLKYGYSAVGKVIETGSDVDSALIGRKVFGFNPHESFFSANPEDLVILEEGINPLDYLFLPNMETAMSFVMDGQPVIGETVLVFGQGIVGLLTTAVLAAFPLAMLMTLDSIELRRNQSLQLGAHKSVDPANESSIGEIRQIIRDFSAIDGADLVYELSGNPNALNSAIELTGFSGRVIVGSWYGEKEANLSLGGRFHRNKIRLISSQVSSVAPQFTGLWTKSRRMEYVLKLIQRIKPSMLISHRFPIHRAPEAYELLDQSPSKSLQVIFDYEE